ncbi:hypothetical protein GQ55_3G204600 [Panicum hallii var. hallii]|uniref:Uncharacterized protein n=1 Tax=Panicum hallii var. hallii TaxID=1504633 RepID=A0A2T7EBI7_9POAL|nr:hypothetical protein GQ55_3G204600 [Panicum hallii var. hallii]
MFFTSLGLESAHYCGRFYAPLALQAPSHLSVRNMPPFHAYFSTIIHAVLYLLFTIQGAVKWSTYNGRPHTRFATCEGRRITLALCESSEDSSQATEKTPLTVLTHWTDPIGWITGTFNLKRLWPVTGFVACSIIIRLLIRPS